MSDYWAPELPEDARAIRVQQRSVNLESAKIELQLSCGHSITIALADFPLIRIVDTLGIPELGEAVDCPLCGRELPTFIGEISDEVVR